MNVAQASSLWSSEKHGLGRPRADSPCHKKRMSNLYDSIFITGGNGMLARALIEGLRRRGHRPAYADRDVYDLTVRDDVEKIFSEYRPTLLLNCAAYTAV